MNNVSDAEKAILARLATEDIVSSARIADGLWIYERIANDLERIRQRICPYPINGTSCDCKYGLGYGVNVRRSEKTGCPELRELIAVYRATARGYPES